MIPGAYTSKVDGTEKKCYNILVIEREKKQGPKKKQKKRKKFLTLLFDYDIITE